MPVVEHLSRRGIEHCKCYIENSCGKCRPENCFVDAALPKSYAVSSACTRFWVPCNRVPAAGPVCVGYPSGLGGRNGFGGGFTTELVLSLQRMEGRRERVRNAGPFCGCVFVSAFTLGTEAVVGCCTLRIGTLGAISGAVCCTFGAGVVGDTCRSGASMPKTILSRWSSSLVALLRRCISAQSKVRAEVVSLSWHAAGLIVLAKAFSCCKSLAPYMFGFPVCFASRSWIALMFCRNPSWQG